MGISYAAAQFLANACRDGVSFERTLTLGRQDLTVSPIVLTRLLERDGLLPDPVAFRRQITRWPYRADPFLEVLGARELSFMDNTPFEGADVIHDLNEPIPDSLKEKYDLVVDGGTLEHVFNFPIALRSTMEMVKVGGHAIFLTPTNNWPGHGFYQFSPELYHQALSEQNGFRVERMLAIEDQPARRLIFGRVPVALEGKRPAYEIPPPPASAGLDTRVEFTTTRPTQLFVLASRQERVPVLASPPQQALYRALWKDSEDTGPGSPGAPKPVRWPLGATSRIETVGLRAALHLAYGGIGRRLGPLRNLAVASYYRSQRLRRQKRGIKRSDQIRT